MPPTSQVVHIFSSVALNDVFHFVLFDGFSLNTESDTALDVPDTVPPKPSHDSRGSAAATSASAQEYDIAGYGVIVRKHARQKITQTRQRDVLWGR